MSGRCARKPFRRPQRWRPLLAKTLQRLQPPGPLLPSALAGVGLLGGGGLLMFGSLLLSLPMQSSQLAQMQELNRELGRLCSNPPRQALRVCRLHAQLVSAM